MPKLFISYSHVDRPFVNDFVPILREKYEVWFDEGLKGGQEWWQEILNQIKQADIFIYLLSNESVISPYCRDEYQEAIRLRKQFLPVVIRAKTEIPEEIKRIQTVDFSSGLRNKDSWTALYDALTYLVSQIKKRAKPLETEVTPLPDESRVQFIDTIYRVAEDKQPATFALATNMLYSGVLGRDAAELRKELHLKKIETPRKHLGPYALLYIQLAEKLISEKLRDQSSLTQDELIVIISQITEQVRIQVKATSALLGYDLATQKPF